MYSIFHNFLFLQFCFSYVYFDRSIHSTLSDLNLRVVTANLEQAPNSNEQVTVSVRGTYVNYNVVNTYSEDELCRVIWDYGEEKFAKKIASNIVKAREVKEIETTFELNELIKAAIPAKMRATGGHPSKSIYACRDAS